MLISTAELASGPPKSMKLQFRPDFRGPDLHQCCAARSAASGKRKRPPAQRKIFGFHNPHYRFPDTELSGIRARAPRQNPDFVTGISDFWRSEAVSAPQAKKLRFRSPKVTISAKSRVSPRQRARGPDFLADFLIGKIANPSLVF